MKIRYVFFLSVLVTACSNPSHKTNIRDSNLAIANHFADAFYSFNLDSLKNMLADAKGSQPNILYYQQWAACGHYKVLKRDAYATTDSIVVIPVTVKDDLMAALKIGFNVTDTFHIVIKDGHIRSITNTSNDPAAYYTAKEWVKKNRQNLIDKPCKDIWDGGPTPCECIQGMLKGFDEYVVNNK